MTEPLFFAATALAQTAATSEKIASHPIPSVQRSQTLQAEKVRLDRILRQLRTNVRPEAATDLATASFEGRPRSGPELFAQRSITLAMRHSSAQLPGQSRPSAWVPAMPQPTYQQWRSLLAREANQVKHQSVGVLLGDSLSLWFPGDRLPQNRVWLNQAISGDTTTGILHRLTAFAQVRPQVVYLMAGINDLKNGVSDQAILQNLRQIVQRLRRDHPHAQIVVQSILPTRSLPIANYRIVQLNRQLQAIARQQGAYFLDVHTRMADQDGYLRSELTTDGLHLNQQGYAVWQTLLQQADTYIAHR
jgi:lysophospholipase L1-like esterase